ncbi:MAG TPA: PilZ domain-containing protein [Aquimonas sp.]|jgi:c-di-GMP-binding flagellar brake protein YcgR|nr:PilZ domain-containing protein [Xanthomonadales bacterium]HRD71675.1 PilZ domain-containing protein [Aquimonas sp.]HRF53051.1 PilZ domain-containing protein [Aquimonas sp.]
MSEHRRAKRKRAQENIDVVDTMTEQAVGRIGNLSENGMMMQATAPLTEDALYQLRFTLGGHGMPSRVMEVGAHQLWSETTHVPGQFWCGFRFIDIAPADAEHLIRWVEQPGGQFD